MTNAGNFSKENVIRDLGINTDKLDEMTSKEKQSVMKATKDWY